MTLKRQEIGVEESDEIEKLKVCAQSIYHWTRYCEYHYLNLTGIVDSAHLAMDRISVYTRAGDSVPLRFVYEANIVAFLQSLHALLDSFPYLLNLFIPVYEDPEDKKIGWQKNFLKQYQSTSFHDALLKFWLDEDFQMLKGYVNTLKHKRLVRISNQWKRIEFESFSFERRRLDEYGRIVFSTELAGGCDVVTYLSHCHDVLIPRFFALCNYVLIFKEKEISNVS